MELSSGLCVSCMWLHEISHNIADPRNRTHAKSPSVFRRNLGATGMEPGSSRCEPSVYTNSTIQNIFLGIFFDNETSKKLKNFKKSRLLRLCTERSLRLCTERFTTFMYRTDCTKQRRHSVSCPFVKAAAVTLVSLPVSTPF